MLQEMSSAGNKTFVWSDEKGFTVESLYLFQLSLSFYFGSLFGLGISIAIPTVHFGLF